MVLTDEATRLFADADRMYEAAIERLEAGDIRDAAEKAWCATKQASGALIISRDPTVPINTPQQVSRGMRLVRAQGGENINLWRTYVINIKELHGDCFYDGVCEPEGHFRDLIHDTSAYIATAKRLAGLGQRQG